MFHDDAKAGALRLASLLRRHVDSESVARMHQLELHARIWKCALDDPDGPDLLKEHVHICIHSAQFN